VSKVLWTANDKTGMPRAYAKGPIEKDVAVMARCQSELSKYIREKRAIGEELTRCDFSLRREVCDE